MKKILTTILTMAISFTSCKTEDTSTTDEVDKIDEDFDNNTD